MAEEIVTMQDGTKIIATVSRLPDDSRCTEGDCRNATSSTLRDLPVCRSCFDKMRGERDEVRAEVVNAHRLQALAEKIAWQAQSEVGQLRALLREVEWGGHSYRPWCPVCHREQFYGHAPDCRLAAELKEGRDE